MNIGKEDDFFPETSQSEAKVNVFVVKKKFFVESMNAKKKFSRNHECRAAHPSDRSSCVDTPERGSFGKTGVISECVYQGDASTNAPRLRHFQLDEKFHAENAKRGIFPKSARGERHISFEETRVGIEDDEYGSASSFGRSIDGETEAAIFGESDECKGKSFLE